MSQPLFRRLLGATVETLPPALLRAHDADDRQVWTGQAEITASGNPLARLLCRMMRLPRPGMDVPVTVTFERHGEEELWCRDFAGRRYESRLTARHGLMVEAMGPATNIFHLSVEGGRLHFRLVAFRFLGLPLPGFLRPDCHAIESDVDGCYRFDVPVSLPGFGTIIYYTGVMQRRPDGQAAQDACENLFTDDQVGM